MRKNGNGNGNGIHHKPTEKEEIPVTKCQPGNAVGSCEEFKIQFDPRLGSLRGLLFDPWNGCFHSRKAREA